MINIQRWLAGKGLKSRMLLQVHDKLVLDTHKDEVELVKSKVSELMRNAIQLDVPMEVEAGVGENWLEAH